MSTLRIALLMERLVGFNYEVLRGVRDYAGPSRGWACHFADPRADLLPLVARWEPHGILGFLGNEEIGQEVARLGLPMVDVAAWVERPPWPRVGLDDVAIGRLAAEHLLSLGFERFAFIGDVALAFSAARSRGYEAGLADYGYTLRSYATDPKWFPASRRWTMGVNDELVSWMAALPKPVALFADNDERALLASEACRAAGLEIPDDVAILGVDDDPYLCRLGYPPISSIATPARRLGFEAASLLDRLMQGAPAPDYPLRLPPCGVVVRRSTDAVAYGDPEVAEAVRFIRANFASGLKVEDVVAHGRVGRRTLERRFQTYVGRSLLEEITRVRLDKTRRLLATTDLPLDAVAREAGFGSAAALSVAHRAAFGETPSAFRRSARSR
jgi:LacI family transcriptional regulator